MAVPGRSIPNVPFVGRGSLADAPVLTTPQPIVSTVPGKRGRPNVVLLRGSLADDPVLTTPQALVVGRQPPRVPGVIFTARSSTEDAAAGPASATLPPIVCTIPPRPRPGVVVLGRGALADDPVYTTTGPIVVAVQPKAGRGVAAVLRSSLIDDVVTPDALPAQPIVAVQVPRPRGGVAWTSYSLPADQATPPPIVVAAAARRPGGSIIWSRGSLADLATPQPLVVAQQGRPRPGVVWVTRTPPAGDTPPAPVLGPDLLLVLGPPEAGWRAGDPSSAWTPGPTDPDSRWTASPPEV